MRTPAATRPDLERVQALGVQGARVYEATGTSEDIAMLLAFERGAELIVAVGTHANLIEFLDKGRKGMASTFLVRLRVGPILIDAKGVSRLYQRPRAQERHVPARRCCSARARDLRVAVGRDETRAAAVLDGDPELVVPSEGSDLFVIDFRYHLISIVAVLLALSIGIVMGSGVLGGPLLDDLKDRADRIRELNEDLRAESGSRLTRIKELEDFLEDSEPYLVNGALVGEEIVLFEFPGVSASVTEELRSSVGLADGSVVTQIEFTDKLEMEDDIERDELALALASASASREDLRVELASLVGLRSASATDQRDPGGPNSSTAEERLDELLNELEDSEFVSVDRTEGEETVPGGSLFMVVGGTEDPAFEMAPMATELSLELAEGGPVMVGETSDSEAEILIEVVDASVEAQIATTGGVDTIIGRVAAVLGMDLASEGQVGHYGLGPTATEVIPPFPGG